MLQKQISACALAAALLLQTVAIPVQVEAVVSAPVDQLVEINQENRDLIARVVMSEAGGEPMIGKVAVVATIFNRARIYDQTIAEVIYAPNQYSTADNGEPTEECYEAIDIYCKVPELYPDDMIYFQLDCYTKNGKDFLPIGSHYFSTKKEQKDVKAE